jgi:hypothetical protein
MAMVLQSSILYNDYSILEDKKPVSMSPAVNENESRSMLAPNKTGAEPLGGGTLDCKCCLGQPPLGEVDVEFGFDSSLIIAKLAFDAGL